MEPMRPKTKKKRRTRGRPPVAPKKRRGDRVTLRFTSAELGQLQRLANGWGVKVGEALRRCFATVANQEKE
jgi:uncharacterized protein (DUF4415 family)